MGDLKSPLQEGTDTYLQGERWYLEAGPPRQRQRLCCFHPLRLRLTVCDIKATGSESRNFLFVWASPLLSFLALLLLLPLPPRILLPAGLLLPVLQEALERGRTEAATTTTALLQQGCSSHRCGKQDNRLSSKCQGVDRKEFKMTGAIFAQRKQPLIFLGRHKDIRNGKHV